MMDRYINQNAAIDAYPTDAQPEMRPLEEIAGLTDELSRMNTALDAYLGRFNGPSPAQLSTGGKTEPRPPSCYRYEIGRLRETLGDTNHLVDSIVRLG